MSCQGNAGFLVAQMIWASQASGTRPLVAIGFQDPRPGKQEIQHGLCPCVRGIAAHAYIPAKDPLVFASWLLSEIGKACIAFAFANGPRIFKVLTPRYPSPLINKMDRVLLRSHLARVARVIGNTK